MPIAVFLIGAILVVVAVKNTHGSLFTALETDVPGFSKWFLAVALVGGLGYVPGLEKPSRYLLALVMLVLFLANYTNILKGFQNAASGASAGATATGAADPASSYVTSPTGTVSTASIAGTTNSGSTSSTASSSTSSTASTTATNPFDPSTYLKNFASSVSTSSPSLTADLSSMGFGGVS